jgi:uncharacterized protein (TIGR03437 family)
MRRILCISICLFTLNLAPGFGQGITLVGTGYGKAGGFAVSPGQIATFLVTGLQTVLPAPQKSASAPLPTSLAGISIDILVTSSSFASTRVIHAPLLGIEQSDRCGGPVQHSADCLVTAITAQIPFEIGPASPVITITAVIWENGTASKEFALTVVNDNLHLLTTCETAGRPRDVNMLQPCGGLVTHGDGTLVSMDAPAKAGETVVLYALGLGQTSPEVKTGDASPTPAAVVTSPIRLQLDFRPNAGPARPYINPLVATAATTSTPMFVGLTPGQVGLYQINVTIPSTIPVVERCGTTCAPTACTIYNTVQSNLTISIGANTSFDGAAICVQAPQ